MSVAKTTELCRILENLRLVTKGLVNEDTFTWTGLAKTQRLLSQFLARSQPKITEKNTHESLTLNVVRVIRARGAVQINDLAKFAFRSGNKVSPAKKQKLHFVLRTLEALELIKMEKSEGSRREMAWQGVESMVFCAQRLISKVETVSGENHGIRLFGDTESSETQRLLANRTVMEFDQSNLSSDLDNTLILPKVNVSFDGNLMRTLSK